ncbi:MAG: hypothetical protein AAF732_08295 [Pseudomonadota bacterium]
MPTSRVRSDADAHGAGGKHAALAGERSTKVMLGPMQACKEPYEAISLFGPEALGASIAAYMALDWTP